MSKSSDIYVSMSKCDHCSLRPDKLDQIKPYLIDRQNCKEYISGWASKDDFYALCHSCFDKQLKNDEFIYKGCNIIVPVITWDDPFGKNKAPENTIVNKAPTNLTLDDVVKIFEKPKSAILEERNKADIRKWEHKQREFEEKLEKKEQMRVNAILAVEKQNKLNNKKKLEEKEEQIAAAKELYPNETKFIQCLKCLTYRAKTQFHKSGMCIGCFEHIAEYKAAYNKSKTITCKCGTSYVCTSDRARVKHEQSDKHKNNMKCLLSFNSSKYTVLQLRKICTANQVLNASRMSKESIVSQLNKLPNVIIPEFKDK